MIKKLSAYIFVLALLISCKKENALDCLKSNGAETTEIRNPGNFECIKLYDKIDVHIRQGSEFQVSVTAGKNLLRNISTSVSSGTLSILNNNKCNFVRGYKKTITLQITVPSIRQVENRGVGTIRFDENFVQDSLLILAENSGDTYLNGSFKQLKTGSHGNGDIYASGNCNSLFVYTFGTNSFYGKELTVSDYIFVETISIGECRVKAPENGKLECNIWRAGNIYYSGNPATVTKFSTGTGTGQLIKE